MFISLKSKKMEDQQGYIIRTDDWDRYYWEVYVNDIMVYIASSREEAEEYLLRYNSVVQ